MNERRSALSSPSCAIRAVGMPSPTSPPSPLHQARRSWEKLVPIPVAGRRAEERGGCVLTSLRSRERGEELEIALADTDTCAEQQGPALAVVIAHCTAMSQPEPRSGGTRPPSLPHRAGSGPGPAAAGIDAPPVLWKGGPKHRSKERMGVRASLQLFKLSRCFQVPGRAARAVICCIISVASPARGAPACGESASKRCLF